MPSLSRVLALVVLLPALASCGGDDPPAPRWQIVHEVLPGALISVWGTSSTDVWSVGGDAGDGPMVIHFDGERWEQLDTGTSGDLWWVHGFEGGPVFVGGEGGQILRYEGGAFEAMETPADTGTVFGIWGTSPDDLWAVGGSGPAGMGFVWRWNGTEWSAVPLPPEAADGNVFKVWGTAPDRVWLVGTGGLLVRWNGDALEVIPTDVSSTLLTVHARGDRVATVGGAGLAVILERDPETGDWVDASPELTPQLMGVWLTEEGGWASGVNGVLLERQAEGWVTEDTGFALAEQLHAVWVDPDGGVWAAGGQLLSEPLVQGILMHRGPREVPTGGL